MLAVLGVICFVICTKADPYLEACTIGDNKNALDHNPSMKTERRITFQRGDFIRFDSKNDIVVGSIENIFVHEVTVKETRGNISEAMLRTMGAPRFIVGLLRWTRYLGMGTGNARDFTISFLGVRFHFL